MSSSEGESVFQPSLTDARMHFSASFIFELPMPDIKPFIVNEALSQQDGLNLASDLLRCIIATANEASDGHNHDLTISILHLAQMAKAMVDRSLDSIVA
ncbi:hypothetical protein PSCICP_48490 [Pseudomonas cichorii]|uniref:DUF3077 domain-containing protein n=2 Tax=Pseudomonas syringae group TaxID=136849 RepID=A0ABQ1DV69_PSECI|nr:hypothetical protein PSCICP_48490 [Pseudomonas cichorii]